MCLAAAGTHTTNESGTKMGKDKSIHSVDVSTATVRVQMSTVCNIIHMTSSMHLMIQYEVDRVWF